MGTDPDVAELLQVADLGMFGVPPLGAVLPPLADAGLDPAALEQYLGVDSAGSDSSQPSSPASAADSVMDAGATGGPARRRRPRRSRKGFRTLAEARALGHSIVHLEEVEAPAAAGCPFARYQVVQITTMSPVRHEALKDAATGRHLRACACDPGKQYGHLSSLMRHIDVSNGIFAVCPVCDMLEFHNFSNIYKRHKHAA